jgi:hypothetical protein
MNNKMTYAQAIENALKVVDGETAEKLTALKAKLEERNAKRNDKKADANAQFKETVKQALQAVGKPATVTELLATGVFEVGISNQKVSAALKQMVETDRTVTKEVDKKKSYFTLV